MGRRSFSGRLTTVRLPLAMSWTKHRQDGSPRYSLPHWRTMPIKISQSISSNFSDLHGAKLRQCYELEGKKVMENFNFDVFMGP
jgi:hypothetical protein